MAQMPLMDGDPAQIGRYRLTARLGAGGMGVVYLGTARDGSQAAIKMLRPELAADHEFRARFRREVRVLAQVHGMCTVRVIEADTESAKPFLATEYADGPSLAERVGQHGPLAAELLPGLSAGLAEALVAIHAAGIIHRDLKPGNVLLTQAGPKVIDFGIAQALDGTILTRTGMTVGSPGFMAPEQIKGLAGQPADIFCWGLTVAYAASGRPPFGTGPSDAIMFRILHDSPDINAVPLPLRPLVEAALAKNPADRPTAADLLWKLTLGTDAAGTYTHPPTQAAISPAGLLPAPAPARPNGPVRTSRRRPLALLAVAACLAAAAGVGAAYLASHGGKPEAGPTTSSTSSAKNKPTPASTPAVAAAAAAAITVCTTPVISQNCTDASRLESQPVEITNSVDGSGYIKNLRWTGWGTATATGTGTMELDNCTPNCAQGHDTPYAATITLTHLVPYGDGTEAYASMAISVPGAPDVSRSYSTGLTPL